MANEVTRALVLWIGAAKEKGNGNHKPFTYLVVPGATPSHVAAMSGPQVWEVLQQPYLMVYVPCCDNKYCKRWSREAMDGTLAELLLRQYFRRSLGALVLLKDPLS